MKIKTYKKRRNNAYFIYISDLSVQEVNYVKLLDSFKIKFGTLIFECDNREILDYLDSHNLKYTIHPINKKNYKNIVLNVSDSIDKVIQEIVKIEPYDIVLYGNYLTEEFTYENLVLKKDCSVLIMFNYYENEIVICGNETIYPCKALLEQLYSL